VALARSLVRDPELLLLDEPFGALDALTRMRMHVLLAELWVRHKPAVLLVTHDVDEALLLAHRAVVLSAGSSSAAAHGATIVADVSIDLPTPRNRRDARFAELRRVLLGHLGVPDEGEVRETEHPPARTYSGVRALSPTPIATSSAAL
jgi:sulfonate transport system ATP-binding protein